LTTKTDPKFHRDADILSNKLTHADRAKINKAWARAIKLGPIKMLQIEDRRAVKRGFEVS
jgi:hypothetical protein